MICRGLGGAGGGYTGMQSLSHRSSWGTSIYRLSLTWLAACLPDGHVNLYRGLIDFLLPACLSDGPIRCGTWPTT